MNRFAAIAIKALKEIAYHLRWSSEWVIRLGDGTEESRERMKKAIDELWNYTEEMFIPANYELEMLNNGIGTDVALLKEGWMQKVEKVFSEAGLYRSCRYQWSIQEARKENIQNISIRF